MSVVKSLLKCFHFILYVLLVLYLLSISLQVYMHIRPIVAIVLSLVFAVASGVAFNYEMIMGSFKEKLGKYIVNICIGLAVLLLSSVLVFHFIIFPCIPYDYMSNLDWGKSYENLSTPQKKVVYSIPEDVAKRLKTDALLETILENPWLVDLNAYNDYVMAVKSREMQFRIVEFLSREDAVEVLDKYIAKYKDKLSDIEKEMGYTVEEVILTPELSEKFREQFNYSDLFLDINFMERIKDCRSEILN